MQNDTRIQSLKRKRVDNGKLLGPDGFTPSKPSSKSGRTAAPSFHSAFDTGEKPKKQKVTGASENSLVFPKPAGFMAEKPRIQDAAIRASEKLLTGPVLPKPLGFMAEKPKKQDATRASENSPTAHVFPKPAGFTVSQLVLPQQITHATRHNTRVKQTVRASALAQSISGKKTAAPETHSAVSEQSLSKPDSKLRLPVVPPRPETSPTKTPAKPLLKPLLPPRLPPPKPAMGQKALPLQLPLIPPIPPSKPLRTIATTRVALATDLSTENGTAELASIFLQDPDLGSLDRAELRSGLDLSPHKSSSSGKGPKFVRYAFISMQLNIEVRRSLFYSNGLAARAAALFSHSNTSLALWAKESSTMARLPKADLRLRVVKIIHYPSKEAHTMSMSGLALCRTHHNRELLSNKDPRTRHPAEFPLLDTRSDEIDPHSPMVLVHFSFAVRPSPLSTPIRNVADFKEEVEFWVWKPWRTVTLNSSQTQSLKREVGSGEVEDIALFCDRFGRHGVSIIP